MQLPVTSDSWLHLCTLLQNECIQIQPCPELCRIGVFTLLASYQVSLPQFQRCWSKKKSPLGQRQRIFVTFTNNSSQNIIIFLLWLLKAHFRSHQVTRARWCMTLSRLQDKRSILRKETPSFVIGCKQTCPIFAPCKETLFLRYWTENNLSFAPEGDTLSSSKAIHWITILEKMTQQNRVSCLPVHETWRNARDPWKTATQQMASYHVKLPSGHMEKRHLTH